MAPFLSGPSQYGTEGGSEFLFVFDNGSILEGSALGPVYLDGVALDLSGQTLTKNDFLFDPPGSDPAFLLHLSCSDPFTGGWGQSAGPVEGVDVNWQIDYFSIARYNGSGEFFRNCGNVLGPFDVSNTATAAGVDSFGPPVEDADVVSDTDMVTIKEGIALDRLQTNGKRLTVRLTNYTGDDKIIDEVYAVWPNGNGNLTKVWLTFDRTNDVVWDGTDDPTEALLNAGDPDWIGGTLLTGEAILRFDFKNKVADRLHDPGEVHRRNVPGHLCLEEEGSSKTGRTGRRS